MRSTFIMLLAVELVLSMRSSEFCINKNKQCMGVYSSRNGYSEKCSQLECQGDHSYKCEKDFCSSNKKTCERFFPIYKFIESVKTGEKQSDLKKYTWFSKGFKECPTVKYNLKPNDICLNTKSCLYMEVKINMAEGEKKQLACPCVGATGYHCGINYCAVHSTACEALKAAGFNVSSKVVNCPNFNVFAQRKLTLF